MKINKNEILSRSRDRIYIKGYRFLSFAKSMEKN